ncbi:MAG: RNA pyrophosphohydrolase [Alphaproteobacteria bacterium]|nr:RNA pyrophosphohydrolase [Alphaproteobacteria bacterium]TAD88668.1 MAG: RNA pyrophosphohydrolase [Alphaproteobacteria bacterium]
MIAAADSPPKGYRLGAGVMVVNGAGLAFVAERSDAPGAWQMPQGGLSHGESPEEAAYRELEEETGITSVERLAEVPGWLTYDFPAEVAAGRWKGKWRGQSQRWFLARFTGPEDEIDLGKADAEFRDWRWVDVGIVPDLIIAWKQPLYHTVVQHFLPIIRTVTDSPSAHS